MALYLPASVWGGAACRSGLARSLTALGASLVVCGFAQHRPGKVISLSPAASANDDAWRGPVTLQSALPGLSAQPAAPPASLASAQPLLLRTKDHHLPVGAGVRADAEGEPMVGLQGRCRAPPWCSQQGSTCWKLAPGTISGRAAALTVACCVASGQCQDGFIPRGTVPASAHRKGGWPVGELSLGSLLSNTAPRPEGLGAPGWW